MLMGGINTSGLGGTFAFAPSDKIVIASNVQWEKIKNKENLNKYQSYGLLLGYNHKFNPQSHYMAFLGYGLGNSTADNNGDGFFIVSSKATGNFQKISFIHAYALDFSDAISLNLSLELFLLDFFRLQIEEDKLLLDIQKDYAFFAEPSATIFFGKKNLKVFAQGAITSRTLFQPEFEYRFFQIGLGLRYNIINHKR